MTKEQIKAYEEQLKPCPFCGRKATIYQDEWGFNLISCHNTDCPIEPCSQNKDIEQAVKDWNTRAISALSENKGEWIPVSERLPEESGRYLTYIVNEYDKKIQYIMTADYISRPTPIEGLSPWNVDDECASDNVVAWQPLPEPYKAESEEA